MFFLDVSGVLKIVSLIWLVDLRFRISFAQEQQTDPGKAASFLDCNGDIFWQRFRSAYSATGPLSPESGFISIYEMERVGGIH